MGVGSLLLKLAERATSSSAKSMSSPRVDAPSEIISGSIMAILSPRSTGMAGCLAGSAARLILFICITIQSTYIDVNGKIGGHIGGFCGGLTSPHSQASLTRRQAFPDQLGLVELVQPLHRLLDV